MCQMFPFLDYHFHLFRVRNCLFSEFNFSGLTFSDFQFSKLVFSVFPVQCFPFQNCPFQYVCFLDLPVSDFLFRNRTVCVCLGSLFNVLIFIIQLWGNVLCSECSLSRVSLFQTCFSELTFFRDVHFKTVMIQNCNQHIFTFQSFPFHNCNVAELSFANVSFSEFSFPRFRFFR